MTKSCENSHILLINFTKIFKNSFDKKRPSQTPSVTYGSLARDVFPRCDQSSWRQTRLHLHKSDKLDLPPLAPSSGEMVALQWSTSPRIAVNLCGIGVVLTRGGSKRRRANLGVHILLFSCSFRQKIGYHTHFGSWRTLQENPGSATANPKGADRHNFLALLKSPIVS